MIIRLLAEIDSIYQQIAARVLEVEDVGFYGRGCLDTITLVRQRIGKIVESSLSEPIELKLFVPPGESGHSE